MESQKKKTARPRRPLQRTRLLSFTPCLCTAMSSSDDDSSDELPQTVAANPASEKTESATDDKATNVASKAESDSDSDDSDDYDHVDFDDRVKVVVYVV